MLKIQILPPGIINRIQQMFIKVASRRLSFTYQIYKPFQPFKTILTKKGKHLKSTHF